MIMPDFQKGIPGSCIEQVVKKVEVETNSHGLALLRWEIWLGANEVQQNILTPGFEIGSMKHGHAHINQRRKVFSIHRSFVYSLRLILIIRSFVLLYSFSVVYNMQIAINEKLMEFLLSKQESKPILNL
jgi:hypothetical protein